jgi:hypothetical protein
MTRIPTDLAKSSLFYCIQSSHTGGIAATKLFATLTKTPVLQACSDKNFTTVSTQLSTVAGLISLLA